MVDDKAVSRELLRSVLKPLGLEIVEAALRVVAVTAYAMQSDRDKAIAAGFDGYVTKPINAVQVRKYVEVLLRT